MKLPAPLEAVVEALQKLPGVGTKSAQRMALHLLKEGPQAMEHLGDLLHNAELRMEAAIAFVKGGGARAVIAALGSGLAAMRGDTGTTIVAEGR